MAVWLFFRMKGTLLLYDFELSHLSRVWLISKWVLPLQIQIENQHAPWMIYDNLASKYICANIFNFIWYAKRTCILEHTLTVNVMESPTRWLHGFIFRHDFEIIRDSSYKSCSRDYSYICRQQINVRKCSTNANPKPWIFLDSSYSCLYQINWSHVLSQEWRCSWRIADIQLHLSDQQLYCSLRCDLN